MAQTIKLRRSAQQGAVPTTEQLQLGELAINTRDGKVFIKKSDGTNEQVVEVGSGAQADLLNIQSGLESPDYIQFDTNAVVTAAEGKIWYNPEDDTLNIGMSGGVIQQVGQEFYMPPCKNTSGVTINNGDFVMATGVQGDKITIAKATSNGSVSPEYMIGIATQQITADSEHGLICTNGVIRDINTSAWPIGTILYPNPAVAGGLTSTKPIAPAIKTPIAIVLRQHETTGRILVRMSNGSVLGGTDSNVEFTTLNNADLVVYNSATSRWENKSLIATLGYTPANKAGDTFTGSVSFPGGSVITSNGDFVARRNSGSTGVYYFVDANDKYLYWDGNQYIYGGSYNVAAHQFYGVNNIRGPIFYDSDNTAYYLDPTGSTSLNVAGNLLASNLILNYGANRYVRIGSSTNYAYDLQTTGDDFQIIEAGTTPRLTIKYPNGFTGIGTAIPYNNLETAANGGATLGISNTASGAGILYGKLAFYSTDAVGNYKEYGGQIRSYSGIGIDYGDLRFYTANGAVAAERMTISNAGNVAANVDIRAPIFYDSDNTAYWLDAAGNSVFSAFNVGGGEVYVYGSATNALGIRTGAGGAYKYFNFDASGNFHTQNGSVYSYTFYDKDNTGYYVDPSSTTVVSRINSYNGIGILRSNSNAGIWFNSIEDSNHVLWNDFHGGPGARGAAASGFDGIKWNTYAGIHLRGGNGGAYNMIVAQGSGGNDHTVELYAYNVKQFETESGYALATNQFRTPIIYDSNDTNFYIDPTSVSVMSRLTAGGREMVGQATIDMSGLDQSTYYPVTIPISADRRTTLRIENALNSNVPSWSTHPYGFSLYIEWVSNGSSYGTIGVDRYVINWRESWNSVQIVGGLTQMTHSSQEVIYLRGGGTYYFSADANVTPTIRTSSYESLGQTVAPQSSIVNTPYDMAGGKMSVGSIQTTQGAAFAGTVSAVGDFRAPIFYDSNDTTYYMDPASTSNILGLTVTNTITGSISGTAVKATNLNQARHVNIDFNTLGSTGQFFRAYTNYIPYGGSYNQPTASGDYKVLQWGDVEGGDGATAGNWGGQIVQNFYDDRMFFRRSYGTTWQAWREFIHDGNYTSFAMPIGSSATNSVDVRAPVFYDSNNTAYYVDPASTSKFNTIDVSAGSIRVNQITFTDTSNSQASEPYLLRWISENSARGAGLSWLEFQLNDDNNEEIRIYGNSCAGFECGAISDNLYHRFRSDGWAWHSNYVEAGSSVRGPLFYDSNDTGYYVDPASTTRLSRVAMGGGTGFDATLHITGALGGYNRLTQMSPNGANLEAFNIMAARNASNADLWWSWGVDTSNRWRINQGVGFSTNGIILDDVGNFTAAQNITAYSDISLKTNIQVIDNALEKVCAIRGVTFDRVDLGTRGTGVIAQEVQEVLPEVVLDGEDGIKSVAYGNMVGLLIEAIKELKAEIEELKANK